MNYDLSCLSSVAGYRDARQNIFPSRGSLDWFIRRNKPELIETGALLFIAGQWRVHTDRFDRCVLDIGARLAHRTPQTPVRIVTEAA